MVSFWRFAMPPAYYPVRKMLSFLIFAEISIFATYFAG